MESVFPQASLCAQTASVARGGSWVREQGKASLYHQITDRGPIQEQGPALALA